MKILLVSFQLNALKMAPGDANRKIGPLGDRHAVNVFARVSINHALSTKLKCG